MLQSEKVSVFYGGIRALMEVSLKVESGRMTALIGPNGAGKSTFLKAVSGLVPIQQGQITFQDQPIQGLKPKDIVRLGVIQVPEGRQIFPRMTVLENLEMGGYYLAGRREMNEELEKVYQWFSILQERKGQPGGQLSGGEQQMLAIARGLMAKPKLLLLDEPSFGLAPLIVKEISAIIDTLLHTEGITILLIEQNAQMALKTAHSAYVFENGRVVLSGRGLELLNNEHIQRAYLGI